MRKISAEEVSEAITVWEHAASNDATLRVVNDTIVQIQGDSYFDPILLKNCTNEFQKSARVIGETLVDIGFYVSDTILNWRLKELVNEGKLEARGTL